MTRVLYVQMRAPLISAPVPDENGQWPGHQHMTFSLSSGRSVTTAQDGTVVIEASEAQNMIGAGLVPIVSWWGEK